MKPDNLLRATSAVLLICLNILATLSLRSMSEIRTDIKDFRGRIEAMNLRLFGAEKDIASLQGIKAVLSGRPTALHNS